MDVILTGGVLRKNSFSLVGPLAEESLRKLSADLFFLAVDGFDVHYGLTTPNLLEARVNRAMAESARRTVVVCDSSKFGRRSLSLILPTSAVHETITDKNILKRDLITLREAKDRGHACLKKRGRLNSGTTYMTIPKAQHTESHTWNEILSQGGVWQTVIDELRNQSRHRRTSSSPARTNGSGCSLAAVPAFILQRPPRFHGRC